MILNLIKFMNSGIPLQFDTRQGRTISYSKYGSEGPVCVLLHGWMANANVFDTLLQELQLPKFQLLVPSLWSPEEKPDPLSEISIENLANDIIDLADFEQTYSFHIIGHSMGGQIAQWVAAHHPDRLTGLVLLCSVPANGLSLPEDMANLFRNAGENHEALHGIIQNVSIDMKESEATRLADSAFKIDADLIARSFEAWSDCDFASSLDRIQSPTLVVATDDPAMPFALQKEEVADRINDARIARISGCGHYPHCEAPEQTARVIEDFVDGLAS